MKNIYSLLLSPSLLATSCSQSKEDDPAPKTQTTQAVADGVVQYSLKGVVYQKPAEARMSSFGSGSGLVRSVIVMGYTESATGAPEYVQVYYSQDANAAANAPYKLIALYTEGRNGRPSYGASLVGAIRRDGGTWSGTFAGTGLDGERITEGVFNRVKE